LLLVDCHKLSTPKWLLLFFKLKYANPRSFQGAHRSTGSFSCFFFFILIAFSLVFRSCRNIVRFSLSHRRHFVLAVTCIPRSFFSGFGYCVIIIHPGLLLVSLRRCNFILLVFTLNDHNNQI
jgi:hypothetical protein